MKKLFKQATVSVITAAILGSIIPMKSQAVEITKPSTENIINQENSQTSLPAPPISQGRAVNTSYPQMSMPTVETFSNEDGTGTGYLDVSWEPVEGVSKYQIILFNGSIHSYWDVSADQTTWTTKNKRMFPTAEQIEAGHVNFRRDGSGTEFSANPSTLYKKAYEINGSSLNYSNSLDYYVRVTAVFEDGASPISYATTSSIPLDHINLDIVNEAILDGITQSESLQPDNHNLSIPINDNGDLFGYIEISSDEGEVPADQYEPEIINTEETDGPVSRAYNYKYKTWSKQIKYVTPWYTPVPIKWTLTNKGSFEYGKNSKGYAVVASISAQVDAQSQWPYSNSESKDINKVDKNGSVYRVFGKGKYNLSAIGSVTYNGYLDIEVNGTGNVKILRAKFDY